MAKLTSVTITQREKHIFNFDEPDESEILFPEFVHGMRVELEGVVTRENEMTNSVGFKYEEHILQCHPRKGTVKRYKQQLFLPCKILGTITRESSEGTYDEARPKIVFDDLMILKTKGIEGELFTS